MNMVNSLAQPVLWLDDLPFSPVEVLDVIRVNRQLPMLVRELVLNHTLKTVHLEAERIDQLVVDFRAQQQLNDDETFVDFLSRNHLDERLLREFLSRPHRIVQYREERWGPRANSLYLKHKDRYDRITYRRLQATNADVMQEVFFRLKDREDSWETMARQFPGAQADADARQGPIAVGQIEPQLLAALRKAGPGSVIRPLQIKDQVVVAELETIEASRYDDDLRTEILRAEFDQWLKGECSRMLGKLRLPA